MTPSTSEFERLLAADRRVERRIFWGEIVALAGMAVATIWTLGLVRF